METATMSTPTPLTREKIEEIRAFAEGRYIRVSYSGNLDSLMKAGEYLRALLSEVTRLTAELATARKIVEYAKDKVAFYEYEYLANRFFQENTEHMMAPGKSDPRGWHTYEERDAAWRKWLEEIGDIDPLASVLATAKAEGRREGIWAASDKCEEQIAELRTQSMAAEDSEIRRNLSYMRAEAETCAGAIRSLLTDTPTPKEEGNGRRD